MGTTLPESDDNNENLNDDLEMMRDEEHRKMQEEILNELRTAANSEARVRSFATLVDTFGLDAVLSLIPAIGDAGASGLAGLYLLWEAQHTGLSKLGYLKIIGLQGADFAIGTIPVVGDVVDYFFKANKWTASLFEQKTEELVEKARAAGVAEEDIAKITMAADKLPQLTKKAVKAVRVGKVFKRAA